MGKNPEISVEYFFVELLVSTWIMKVYADAHQLWIAGMACGKTAFKMGYGAWTLWGGSFSMVIPSWW